MSLIVGILDKIDVSVYLFFKVHVHLYEVCFYNVHCLIFFVMRVGIYKRAFPSRHTCL